MFHKTPNRLLSSDVWSHCNVVNHTHKYRCYYNNRHLRHGAGSMIFLENHYGCVLPWGRSHVAENRSREMMMSDDGITLKRDKLLFVSMPGNRASFIEFPAFKAHNCFNFPSL